MPEADFYITADIRGLEFLLSSQFQVDILEKAIEQTALEAVIDMQDAIYEPKAGAISNKSGPYRINNPGTGNNRGYQRFLLSHGPSSNNNAVSLPGEAPANQTDALAQSITYKKIFPFTFQIIVGAYYGFYLEYGTRKMAPRPFFGKALVWVTVRLEKHVKDAFMKIVVVPANTGAGGVSQTPISGITSRLENRLEKDITNWARGNDGYGDVNEQFISRNSIINPL